MLRKFAIALAAGATLGAGVALMPTEAAAWGWGYRCWDCGPYYGWGWRRPYYASYGWGWRRPYYAGYYGWRRPLYAGYGWRWRRPYYAGYYGYGWRPRVVAFGW